jgi:hypothetical protein
MCTFKPAGGGEGIGSAAAMVLNMEIGMYDSRAGIV